MYTSVHVCVRACVCLDTYKCMYIYTYYTLTLYLHTLHKHQAKHLVLEEVVWHLRRSRHLASSLQPKHQQVQHEPVVLDDERGELETSDDAVRVGVVHVLVVYDHVVLGGHVVGYVVLHDQTQESVEEGQIDLLVHLFVTGLHENVTLPLPSLPHLLEVVDAFSEEEGW